MPPSLRGEEGTHQATSNPAEMSGLPAGGWGVARAAGIIALGNVASRVLGLVRETVIAHLFGATGLVSAFRVASILPTMLYDLLIGGMVSSALVPVFSGYAAQEREELWRVASLMLCLTALVLSLVAVVLEFLAPQAAWLLSGGFDPELLAQTTKLMRITIPAVIFMSLSGVLTGLLYALKRFAYPAFTTAVFNAGMVSVALLLAGKLGIASLAVGLLAGAALQVILQLPALRDMRFLPSLDASHPGLRRLVRLYLPVVLGLVINQVGIAIDRNLASRTGARSIAWMANATTLIQFPLGLISVAVSLAILPTLSREAANDEGQGRRGEFQATLASGLRLVLVAIIPATIGLFILAHPIIALLFEHGEFGPQDTVQTALALRCYLIGLIFAAIDQPLVFAFYARQDTLTPALVGAAGVGIYLAVALALIRPLGMIGLVLANSLQLMGHALAMLALFWRRLGGLAGYGVGMAATKALLASLAMGGATYLALGWVRGLSSTNGLAGELMAVGVPGGVGLMVYLAMLALLGAREARMVWQRMWPFPRRMKDG